jgi:SOS response regulatory protein OraA/RecX
MSIFGGDDRPKVTETEFNKVRQSLSEHGFKHEKIERVRAILDDSLSGTNSYQRGIDKNELDKTMSELRAHKDAHLFTPHEMDTIETELRKHL